MHQQGDTLVVIATHLRPEEAGMLRGLLESAGIPAAVRDDVLSGVNPFLRPIIGGAKLAVRADDEDRAREIVRSAGVLPGPPPEEPVEIPEQEWSAPPPGAAAPPQVPAGRTWMRLTVIAAAFLAALLVALTRCFTAT